MSWTASFQATPKPLGFSLWHFWDGDHSSTCDIIVTPKDRIDKKTCGKFSPRFADLNLGGFIAPTVSYSSIPFRSHGSGKKKRVTIVGCSKGGGRSWRNDDCGPVQAADALQNGTPGRSLEIEWLWGPLEMALRMGNWGSHPYERS